MDKDTREKLEELMGLYDFILDGNRNNQGMVDCVDPYYRGAWTDDFVKIKKLRDELELY